MKKKNLNTCIVSFVSVKFEAILKIDNFGLCIFVITQMGAMLWVSDKKKRHDTLRPRIFRISRDGFKIDIEVYSLKHDDLKLLPAFMSLWNMISDYNIQS